MNNSWQHIRALWRAAEDRPRASRGTLLALRRHFAEEGIVGRMARFERFMEETSRERFVWGLSDCSLVLADWAIVNGHEDCADDLRGAYDTAEGCRALLAAQGGLVPVVGACAARIGLPSVLEPEFGAVAVIGSQANPERQWGAIWNGARWAVWWGDEKSARWVPFAATALAIWRI